MDGPQMLVERLQRATNDHDVDAAGRVLRRGLRERDAVASRAELSGTRASSAQLGPDLRVRARPPRRGRPLRVRRRHSVDRVGDDGHAARRHRTSDAWRDRVRRRATALRTGLASTSNRGRSTPAPSTTPCDNRSSADDPRRWRHWSARHPRREAARRPRSRRARAHPRSEPSPSPRRRGDRHRPGRRTRCGEPRARRGRGRRSSYPRCRASRDPVG